VCDRPPYLGRCCAPQAGTRFLDVTFRANITGSQVAEVVVWVMHLGRLDPPVTAIQLYMRAEGAVGARAAPACRRGRGTALSFALHCR
jgi:hypothetical protein